MPPDKRAPQWNTPPSEPDEQHEGSVATESEQQLQRPQLYKVLLHNDDYTTMDFVVMILMRVFHHTEAEAVRIMLQIHHKGVAVAGIYSFEVAEARVQKVARLAREYEFPLRSSMEPET